MKKKIKSSKNHVLYLGDWVFHVGPVFIETPFGMETKDADLVKRMNEGIHALTKEDFKRLETAWKEAWSSTIVNKCQ